MIRNCFCTYDGIRGGGRPGLARAGGGPPGPGRFGMAGAGRPPIGTGGGARELERGGGCVTPRLGPPGDGGDNLQQIRCKMNNSYHARAIYSNLAPKTITIFKSLGISIV